MMRDYLLFVCAVVSIFLVGAIGYGLGYEDGEYDGRCKASESVQTAKWRLPESPDGDEEPAPLFRVARIGVR